MHESVSLKRPPLRQFSLRAVLLLMVVVSGGLALYLGWHRHQHQRELRIAQAIDDVGGSTTVTWQGPDWLARVGAKPWTRFLDRVTDVHLHGDLRPEQFFRLPLEDLRSVDSVELDSTGWSDADIEKLSKRLSGCEVYRVVEPIVIISVDRVVDDWLQNPKSMDAAALSTKIDESMKWSWSSRSEPEELQYSCARIVGDDDQLIRLLRQSDPRFQLVAAQALWRHHSRCFAREVLEWTMEQSVRSSAARQFQADVKASLAPQSLLREMKNGDFEWAAWLAALRPHPTLVQPLIESLGSLPTAEAIYALGTAKDPRAIPPLIRLLSSEDDALAGRAAQALGRIGGKQVEARLIQVLEDEETSAFLAAHACQALGQVGSAGALPLLRQIAVDSRYRQSAIAVNSVAERAVQQIEDRQSQPADNASGSGLR